MEGNQQRRLIQFLQDDLMIPGEHIKLALKYTEQTPSLLPMILWQYGLVSLTQLDRIFDWLETSTPACF